MTTTTFERRRLGRLGTLFAIAATALACLGISATAASAAPRWEARAYWGPSNLQPGERGGFRFEIGNSGDAMAPEWPTVEIELPEGVEFDENDIQGGLGWQCSAAGTPQTVTCGNPIIPFLPPELIEMFRLLPNPHTMVGASGAPIFINFTVDIAADAPVGLHPLKATMSGAGASGATTLEEPIRVGGPPAGFGVREGSFHAETLDEEGNPYTQAGGHPYEGVTGYKPTLRFDDPELEPGNQERWTKMLMPVASPRNILVDLPPGFGGDPLVVPTCAKYLVAERSCPPATQVGIIEINQLALPGGQIFGIYNVPPSRGAPAEFMFAPPAGGPLLLRPVLQSDGDWALRVDTKSITEATVVYGLEARLWGIPADASHDDERCELPSHIGRVCAGYHAGGLPVSPLAHAEPHASTAPRRALFTLPTECDGQPEVTRQYLDAWPNPGPFTPDGDPDLSSPKWVSVTAEAPPVDNCEALDFAPTLKARPTTNVTDSPTGLEVDLQVPQNPDPDGLATAHLRNTVVTLPEGLTVNAAGANGLDACTPAQIHLGDRLPDDCPEAAKVGTVSVETPILEDPVPGAVYVATPHNNPFNSLLAIYIAIDDPKTGIVGKLAGKVTPDPVTGRLTTVVQDNPQVPFEHFKLNFFGGAAASLKTPATCGTYATTSELTPWSAPHTGPPATPSDTYAIDQGPGGAPCASSEAALPNAPTMQAGSTAPIAGAHTDFVVNLRREDGTQRFGSVTVNPPQGLTAKLAGTPPCSEAALAAAAAKSGKAEQASPSCPAASQIGTVVAGAGVGPAPYYAPGKAYLSGPYKGAPLSMAIITPAVAGPFDLGTIVIRTALHLDPKTAQITAVSDPIPTILQGIPLEVRSASVRLDKPSFALNPTSCDETKVGGTLLSTLGQSAALQSRFQLGECGRLGFKPNLKLSLKGATKRGRYPALTAVLTPRAGDANIKSVSVALPHSEFLAQNHIRTVCTRVQFAADQCPKQAIYGTATVYTPLLDYPLTGPVYLRSSDNPLPDLVPDLRGPAYQPIKLEAAGRTDSVNEGIRNSFDFVPDAPFEKLVLKMAGGSKGLLENSTDICKRANKATVSFGAHNGLSYTARPALKARCGKGRKGAKGKGAGKQRGGKAGERGSAG